MVVTLSFMTDAGSDNTGAQDTAQPMRAPSRARAIERYDKRIEGWILGLKDEAEQRAPEVLSELAATARSVGQYLEDMAEQVRKKREKEAAAPEPAQPEDVSPKLEEPPPSG